MTNKTKEIRMTCSSCGAQFHEMLPECPYCGTISYKGAETEYMNKLGAVREDLEDLQRTPKEEVLAEFRRVIKRVGIVLSILTVSILLLLCIHDYYLRTNKESREEYLWKQQNYPVMEQMMRDGRHEELYELANVGMDQGYSIYSWSYFSFYEAYSSARYALGVIQEEKQGNPLSEADYRMIYWESGEVFGVEYQYQVPEEVIEYISPYREALWEDFQSRWGFTPEELEAYQQKLIHDQGRLDYKECQEFVAQWFIETGKGTKE